MRLFVAVPMPERVCAALSRIQEGVAGARWVPPENMHLTLRFIGDVDGGTFEDLVEVLADVVVDPFSIEIAGVGHFERRRVPTTLWAGVKPSSALVHLQGKVERACRRIGLQPESRKFAPHVTLARLIDADTANVLRFLQQNNLEQAGTVQVEGFNLYSSHLGKGTPIYRAEVEYLFEAPVS